MAINQYLSVQEQQILAQARIGIAGAGGLGSNCAMHLVRAGVRNLVIADYDLVSSGNLNRQFFFADQIGMSKVEALQDNLLRITPELELELHPVAVTLENVQELFGSCDIIVEAFDAVAAKEMLFDALLPCGKVVVAVSGLGGWGNSEKMTICRIGKNLILIGDRQSGVDELDNYAPQSPRVGIAAAMQANTVAALLLGEEI